MKSNLPYKEAHAIYEELYFCDGKMISMPRPLTAVCELIRMSLSFESFGSDRLPVIVISSRAAAVFLI